MTEMLLPCPFCGSTLIDQIIPGTFACDVCGAAAKRWNTRASQAMGPPVAWRVDSPEGHRSLHDHKRNAEIVSGHLADAEITPLYAAPNLAAVPNLAAAPVERADSVNQKVLP